MEFGICKPNAKNGVKNKNYQYSRRKFQEKSVTVKAKKQQTKQT